MTEFAPAAEQLEALERGTVDLINEEELGKKLERSCETGKPLVVKVGFDPSTPDIHLGHTVVMRKMKQFQDLGHQIVFVVGDFTGMIGDPSGRSKTRPQLTREEILENAETYRQQAFKVLDESKTRLEFNSTWLEKLGASGFVKLAGKYTVARMLERDDFEKRFKANQYIPSPCPHRFRKEFRARGWGLSPYGQPLRIPPCAEILRSQPDAPARQSGDSRPF